MLHRLLLPQQTLRIIPDFLIMMLLETRMTECHAIGGRCSNQRKRVPRSTRRDTRRPEDHPPFSRQHPRIDTNTAISRIAS